MSKRAGVYFRAFQRGVSQQLHQHEVTYTGQELVHGEVMPEAVRVTV